MQQVLLALHLIFAIVLIGVILLQRNEGGGLSGLGTAGSGGMGGFMSGRSQANLLTRITAIFAVLFIGSSLVLALMADQSAPTGSIFDQAPATSATPAPESGGDSGTSDPDAPEVPLGTTAPAN